ncbi:hypothetical protein D9615_010223 [Tricholomella constricta]|uniref:Uncharacterized protein n=1 Tax=Tricholomella constricta TaxID=117010 RepID=A0A8H5GRE6_9AGAR|nr:hypothetical protein D9615_010223 [Tricholomella constricta]
MYGKDLLPSAITTAVQRCRGGACKTARNRVTSHRMSHSPLCYALLLVFVSAVPAQVIDSNDNGSLAPRIIGGVIVAIFVLFAFLTLFLAVRRHNARPAFSRPRSGPWYKPRSHLPQRGVPDPDPDPEARPRQEQQQQRYNPEYPPPSAPAPPPPYNAVVPVPVLPLGPPPSPDETYTYAAPPPPPLPPPPPPPPPAHTDVSLLASPRHASC